MFALKWGFSLGEAGRLTRCTYQTLLPNNFLVAFSPNAASFNSLGITILVTCILFSFSPFFFSFFSPQFHLLLLFLNSRCVTLLIYKSNHNLSLLIKGWEIKGKGLNMQIFDKINQLVFSTKEVVRLQPSPNSMDIEHVDIRKHLLGTCSREAKVTLVPQHSLLYTGTFSRLDSVDWEIWLIQGIAPLMCSWPFLPSTVVDPTTFESVFYIRIKVRG